MGRQLTVITPLPASLSARLDRVFSHLCKGCKGVCCSYCRLNEGYYTVGPDKTVTQEITREGLDTLKARYWGKDGFRGKAGCRIPRPLRSHTCLLFYCNSTLYPPSGGRHFLWAYVDKLLSPLRKLVEGHRK